jgi:hypothetical protein
MVMAMGWLATDRCTNVGTGPRLGIMQQNTACFRDGKPVMSFEDRFGHCDDGKDGLEELVPVTTDS